MLRSLAVSALALTSLVPVSGFANEWVGVQSAVYHPTAQSQVHYTEVATRRRTYKRRHPVRKTVKRVGIGAGGGAAVGALLGGGKGAAIGALAGGGAGAVYDHHEKNKGR